MFGCARGIDVFGFARGVNVFGFARGVDVPGVIGGHRQYVLEAHPDRIHLFGDHGDGHPCVAVLTCVLLHRGPGEVADGLRSRGQQVPGIVVPRNVLTGSVALARLASRSAA